MSLPASPAPARRRWPFKPWEVVVIATAIALFIAAALAGPREQAAPPAASPSAVGVAPSGTAGAVPTPTATALIPRDAQGRVASPVASIEQVLTEQVGDYTLVNRGLSESGARGGALQAAELRYSTTPPDPKTDVFHGVEVHLDTQAARDRVQTFGAALAESGFEVAERQPLRNESGDVQGAFLELTGEGQRLLLWSNRNVMFSLGGGEDADIDAFYADLPY